MFAKLLMVATMAGVVLTAPTSDHCITKDDPDWVETSGSNAITMRVIAANKSTPLGAKVDLRYVFADVNDRVTLRQGNGSIFQQLGHPADIQSGTGNSLQTDLGGQSHGISFINSTAPGSSHTTYTVATTQGRGDLKAYVLPHDQFGICYSYALVRMNWAPIFACEDAEGVIGLSLAVDGDASSLAPASCTRVYLAAECAQAPPSQNETNSELNIWGRRCYKNVAEIDWSKYYLTGHV
jgi:hypothetical protein